MGIMKYFVRNAISLAIAASFIVAAAACSDDASTASTDGGADGSSSTATGSTGCAGTFAKSCKIGPQCADFYGMTAAEATGLCGASGGTVGDALCTRVDTAGACAHTASPACTEKWYYPASSAASVQAGCLAPDLYRAN